MYVHFIISVSIVPEKKKGGGGQQVLLLYHPSYKTNQYKL